MPCRLQGLGVIQYLTAFQEAEVDLDVLPELQDSDLQV